MSNKDVSLAFPHGYDSGISPSIGLNNVGVAVEVHQSQGASTLWCHVGLTNGGVCNFGGSTQYDSGDLPSVALNDHGVVLEVHESNGLSSNMWYRVGTVNAAAKTVGWNGSIKYDSGAKPKVALNNQGVAVEVHESDGASSNMWYHVGTVSADGKSVAWGSSVKYDSGRTPSVALNNQGLVIEVHQSDGVSFNLWYRVGKVNAAAKTIDWGNSVQYDSGVTPSVILTDDGWVVEVHQSQGFATLWKRVGQVNADNKTIVWQGGSVQYGNGGTPRIATNGQQVIEVQANGSSLAYALSTIQSRSDWMQNNLPLLGGRVLKQLVMPASHDAGMYMTQNCAGAIGLGANSCNTQTQTLSIGGQLEAGVRYFDLRPVLEKDGTLYTGHFDGGTGLGCDGPTIATVLADAATFAASHRELVILKFSHYYNRAAGGGFNDDQMKALCQQVSNALKPSLYVTTQPLGSIALSSFIGAKGIVLPVFDSLSATLKAAFPGLYSYADFPGGPADLTVYDQYADTNDLNGMINDQLGKLANAANHGGNMFLLSWTLTQSTAQAVACGASGGLAATSILDLAAQANAAFWPQAVQALAEGKATPQTVPNLLYIDAVQGFVADLALWFNQNLPTGNILKAVDNAVMVPGVRIYSPGQTTYLTYQQDGNLVLYAAGGKALWASNTNGKPAWQTIMQTDGNFVTYSAPGAPIWASGTSGTANATMAVLDDGHFVIRDASGKTTKQYP